jgi:hypothetical protein
VRRAGEQRQKRSGPHKRGWKLAPCSDEHKKALRNALKNHPVTKASRKKISKAMSGRKITEKTKEKMSNTRINKIIGGYIPFNCANFKRGYYKSKKNGLVYYRSSWELATMKYFDKSNIDWIYETKKNKFYLKTIKRYYINDFYLPKEDKYIQVKGYVKLNNRFDIFRKEYNNLNIELWDRKTLEEKDILRCI